MGLRGWMYAMNTFAGRSAGLSVFGCGSAALMLSVFVLASCGGDAGDTTAFNGRHDGGTDSSANEGGVDGADACPTEGASRCSGNGIEICTQDDSGALSWQTDSMCDMTTQRCDDQAGEATCVDLPSCEDGEQNGGETGVDCGGSNCDGCAAGSGCSVNEDCLSGACANNVCQVCQASTVSCQANTVVKCKADQSGWDVLATCQAAKEQTCDPDTSKCVALKPIGTTKPTGDYYLYALFNSGNSPFKGGADVDSFENFIYINRGSHLDKYEVKLLDSNGNGKLEPNLHPDNPDAQGPMEERKLTFVQTYTNVTLGGVGKGELYAAKDRVYFAKSGKIYEFIFATGKTNLVVAGFGPGISHIGHDELTGQWFASNETHREVFSYYPVQKAWAAEFAYPNLAGSHMDGLEVVTDPSTKTSYVYVSDMTSDFLGQYIKNPKTSKWEQKNLFKYQDNNAGNVEGMGFGAFNHFWVTSGKNLYEIGGGSLQKYVEEPPVPH